jgi:hypothetical protein
MKEEPLSLTLLPSPLPLSPNRLDSGVLISTYITEVLTVGSWQIGSGSFVEILSTDKVPLSLLVCGVLCDGQRLRLTGYFAALDKADPQHVVFSERSLIEVNVEGVLNSFMLVPLSKKKERLFWPSFIRFFSGVDVLSSTPSCSSITIGTRKQLLDFSGLLLTKLEALLKSKTPGEKLLFTYCPLSACQGILQFFELNSYSKQSLVLQQHFGKLRILLGCSYFFLSQEEGEYSKSGWGFKEDETCRHYIHHITITVNPQKLEMKVSAAQLTQNFFGKFQVVKTKK